MISKKITFLIAVLILNIGISPALSVPAAPNVHTLEQKDGSKFMAKLWGDEWNNGFETLDGYTIIFKETSENWVYASLSKDGRLLMSDKIVGNDAPLGFKKHIRNPPAHVPGDITSKSSKNHEAKSITWHPKSLSAPPLAADVCEILLSPMKSDE